jgi:error-prone DNA polymerase
VQVSEWDYTLEADIGGALAIRIGLRQIRSLPEADARRALTARDCTSIDDLAHRATLSRRSMQLLAAAGALQGLSTHRHDATWRALAVEQLPPLLAAAAPVETPPPLSTPTEAQEILADYRQLGLSTGRHPLALLRPWLRQNHIHSSLELRQLGDGIRVRVGGLVTHLQQPGTAAGVTFISLEDETGIANIIVWPQVFATQREAALDANLLVVTGTLQHHDNVIHVVAKRLHNRSHWLASLPRRSRDYR